jgi:hypothetical protein
MAFEHTTTVHLHDISTVHILPPGQHQHCIAAGVRHHGRVTNVWPNPCVNAEVATQNASPTPAIFSLPRFLADSRRLKCGAFRFEQPEAFSSPSRTRVCCQGELAGVHRTEPWVEGATFWLPRRGAASGAANGRVPWFICAQMYSHAPHSALPHCTHTCSFSIQFLLVFTPDQRKAQLSRLSLSLELLVNAVQPQSNT